MSVCTNPNFVLVGIQQLRGPNLRPNFDPLPLEWTIVDILHTTYLLITCPNVAFLLTTYLPLLVYLVSECPLE
jgi:hypothetical protein